MVSTDPAHSLSDSLDQNIGGGQPVQIQGTDLPLWGMEINADEARQRFRASSQKGKSSDVSCSQILGHEQSYVPFKPV